MHPTVCFVLLGIFMSLLHVISEQCSFSITHCLRAMLSLPLLLELVLRLRSSDLQSLSS
jgi:hypothetical protein